jgi:AcrR family transcriptional regulator
VARPAPGVKVARGQPRDNRAAILEAAARTIARRGVRGLRVEEVAAEAGVSAPLLYYHFESRSGLVKAALEAASEQAPSTALRGEPGTGRTGFEAMEAALLAELDDEETTRDNAVVWGEVSASAVFEPELRPDVRRVTETWHAEVAEGIRAGIADASINQDVDPDDAADVLITLVDGLLNRWLAGTIELPRARELLTADLRSRLLP